MAQAHFSSTSAVLLLVPVASQWECFSVADASGGYGRGVAGASWRMLAGWRISSFIIASSPSPLRSRAGALVLFIKYSVFLVFAAFVPILLLVCFAAVALQSSWRCQPLCDVASSGTWWVVVAELRHGHGVCRSRCSLWLVHRLPLLAPWCMIIRHPGLGTLALPSERLLVV